MYRRAGESAFPQKSSNCHAGVLLRRSRPQLVQTVDEPSIPVALVVAIYSFPWSSLGNTRSKASRAAAIICLSSTPSLPGTSGGMLSMCRPDTGALLTPARSIVAARTLHARDKSMSLTIFDRCNSAATTKRLRGVSTGSSSNEQAIRPRRSNW